MEKELNRTLELIRSASRALPAYYTSDRRRSATFCIDFPQLSETDDQEMARESFCSLGDYVPFYKAPSEHHWEALLKLGENCMAGAFILTQLGRPANMPELIPELIKDVMDRLASVEKVRPEWFVSSACMSYIHHCIEFGMKRGLTFSLS